MSPTEWNYLIVGCSLDVEAIFNPVLCRIEGLVADQRLRVKQTGNSVKVERPRPDETMLWFCSDNY